MKLSDDFSDSVVRITGADLEESTMRRVWFRIIPLFCVYHFVNQLEKQNLSFASEGLKEEIGLSDSQYGTVVAGFVFTYAASSIPNTLIGKRVGAKYALPVRTFFHTLS